MHEMAITQQVLDIALAKARESGARTITHINLVVGESSSVIDDSVQFYFDFLSRDTLAQGAQLTFQRIPLKVRCHQCGCIFMPKKEDWKCPGCQQWKVEVVAGKEFYLESIEVD